ncbi:multiprotein bridging factor aMBF1 [Halovenus salina]|uniref:Multiprotein bridging factor aMBF1 n=1 Tax=Halovenus salina TaxID=1510225 RepID=A0ABD5W0E4_9EURY
MRRGIQEGNMVQCEMCGTETASPNRVKIEGLNSMSVTSVPNSGPRSKPTRDRPRRRRSIPRAVRVRRVRAAPQHHGQHRWWGSRRDIYDEMDEIAPDYDERIRNARESAGLTQDELAKQLNEKASLMRKLEHGETLPSDDVREKIERGLDISLTTSGGSDETDWESDDATGGYTLGDVVERNDS